MGVKVQAETPLRARSRKLLTIHKTWSVNFCKTLTPVRL